MTHFSMTPPESFSAIGGSLVNGLGGGGEIGDEAFTDAFGVDDRVSAIAQSALVQLGCQDARLGAADVDYGDEFVCSLAHALVPTWLRMI